MNSAHMNNKDVNNVNISSDSFGVSSIFGE